MKRSEAGITLLELMIVVAIVGILAAIAYPSYRDQVRRSNRTEAKVALEERAQAMEKCFTRTMDYTAAACDNAAAARATPDGRYTVSASARGPTTFTLTAVPNGAQADDAECMSFTLDEAGRRGVTGTGTPERCW